MRCYIYRQPEGTLIPIFNPDTHQFEDVDPIDFIEERAAGASLKFARVNRSITVCIHDDLEMVTWKLIEPVAPFHEYQGYP